MKSLILILSVWGISTVLFIGGCSPSSYSNRYDKPKTEEKKSSSKSARFTSDDDPDAKDKKNNGKSESYANLPANPLNDYDDMPVEEFPVSKSEFIHNYSKLKKLGVPLTRREKILFEIIKYLETPYQYGGESFKGIDCSSFTQQVFRNSVNTKLPRTASEQYHLGENINNEKKLKFGDLIFFDTQKNKFPGHVGIYVGDSLFAHSSSSQGVTISSLKSSYYKQRYVGAKRLQNIFGE